MGERQTLTLPRAALLRELGSTTDDLARLTVLSAPLGYGKTTLLNQWEQRLSGQIRVVRVSAEGVGAPKLWKMLARELAAGKDSPTGENTAGLEAHRDVNRLVAVADQPIFMIIDDADHVTSPDFGESLLRLLEARPNLYIAVSGRRFSLLDSPLAYFRVPTRLLGREDLAFSEDEVAELMQQLGVSATRETETILKLIEGWHFATQAVLQDIQGASPAEPNLEALNEVVLTVLPDPTARRVFGLVTRLPGVPQDFLESTLRVPAGTLDSTLLGLYERGLIHGVRSGNELLYSVHPVLREYPVWMENQEMEAQELSQVRVEFAKHIAQKRPLQALKTLLNADAFDDAEEHAMREFAQVAATPEAALDSLRELSEDVLAQHPSLAGLRMALERPLPEPDLNLVHHLAHMVVDGYRTRAAGDFKELRSSSLTLLIVALRTLGKCEEALEVARYLELRLAEDSYNQYDGGWRGLPLMYLVLAITGSLGGDNALAMRAAKQALRIAAENGGETEQIRAHRLVAFLEGMQGNLGGAEHALKQIEALGSPPVPEILEATWELEELARTVTAFLKGDLPGAKHHLATLLPHLQGSQQWARFISLEAWVTRTLSGAGAAYERMRLRMKEAERRPASPETMASLTALLANLAMYSQRVQAAAGLLAEDRTPIPRLQLARARLAVLQWDNLLAINIIEEVRRTGGKSPSLPEGLLLAAVAYQASGDHASALAMVEELDLMNLESAVKVSTLSTAPYDGLLQLASLPGAHKSGTLKSVADVPKALRFSRIRRLTAAETRVLEGVRDNKTVGAAAVALHLSPNTVKTHLRMIHSKLGVAKRKEALKMAEELGWLKA